MHYENILNPKQVDRSFFKSELFDVETMRWMSIRLDIVLSLCDIGRARGARDFFVEICTTEELVKKHDVKCELRIWYRTVSVNVLYLTSLVSW